MPRGVPKVTKTKMSPSSAEVEVPKAEDYVMPRSGTIDRADIPEIETAAETVNDDWAERMSFANEIVTIRLNETNDPNDEPRVPVCVNGEKAHPKFGNHLPRGVEIQVKRYVAEQLLRAKPINIRTVKTLDADGNDTARIVRTVGTRYPFQIINPSARDNDWLKRVMAEA